MTPPMPPRIPGTEGYAETAEALAPQYESLDFADAHRHVLHLLPAPPSRILDIGAGTGRDAAGFATRGYDVVAVEPTAEFRRIARELHPSGRIRWIDDSLPDLDQVHALGESFGVVWLMAVWMHLDKEERARAMPRVAALLAPAGLLVITLRHGPVPAGRRMFEVSTEETRLLASRQGLVLMHEGEARDYFSRGGVHWTRLAFRRSDGYAL